MSILAIRKQLAHVLSGVQGVRRVYQDEPNVTPSAPDLPCYVLSLRDPMLTVASAINDTVEYNWHFDLVLLYKPEGMGNADENMSGLEGMVKGTLDALYANYAGGGAWDLINKDTGTLEFSGGVLARANAPDGSNRYWGFAGTLDITELVTTTFSTGS